MSVPTAAGPVITFEDYPRGTVITAQYGTRGVVFPNGAFLDEDPAAHSGTRVLRAASLVREFHPAAFRIQFTSAQRRVRLFAGTSLSTDPVSGTLRAIDAAGVQVAQDGPKNVAAKVFTTMFEVAAPGPASIIRVELQMAGEEFEAIDDLEIEGEGPGPLPSQAPVVQFTAPTNNAELDVSSLTVQGTVSGEGLLPHAVLRWETSRAPGDVTPQSGRVNLSGTGATRAFSFPLAAPIGPVTLVLESENSAGLKGTGTVRFTNFPAAIRSRYTSGGGGATFGTFRFGTRPAGANCQMAIYERGAIAAEGSTARVVSEPIITKWLSVRTTGDLGCPTGEERSHPESTRVQDFTRGRIYAGPGADYYIPSVFVPAIDWGGERTTGMPVEDPVKPLGVMETWLFQRFRRYGASSPTGTLEIRGPGGMAPKLYVERIGGPFPDSVSATVVEVFPCQSPTGPCQVDRPLKEPSLAEPIDSGERPLSGSELNRETCGPLRDSELGPYCKNTTWECKGLPALKRALTALALGQAFSVATVELSRLNAELPPEWPAIANDGDQTPADYDQTSLKGFVTTSQQSGSDNPFNHTYPRLADCVTADVLPRIAAWTTGDAPNDFCASDYEVNVIPLRGWRNTLGGVDPGRPLIGPREYVHVEWEKEYMASMMAMQLEPLPRDLVFISGRWIVDCGHTWKTEIHPPSVVASMRHAEYREKGAEDRPGRPATVANVWVTGWYSGDEPVEFLVYPPPRPSPRAKLRLVAPDPVITDVTVTPVMGSNAVRLRVSAPVRRPAVAGPPWYSQSNMTWLNFRDAPRHREFKARYWVLWSDR